MGAALALRLAAPETMPVHTDEAVNASILGDMLEGKPYRYDPVDRHGPTLYFATYPWVRACGARTLRDLEAWQLRAVPAVFGAALLAAVFLLRPGVPAAALLAAALWLGAGAPFVYYGRYWIHETLFVLLTFVAIGAAWRYLRTGRLAWTIAAGLAVGGLVATKETAVLTLAAALAGLAGVRLAAGPLSLPAGWGRGAALAFAAAALAAALLFASFGRNLGGPADAARSLVHAFARAAGQGHEKPWSAYLGWLIRPGIRSAPWCGWTLGLFGCAGALAAWRRRREARAPFFLLLFTLALAVLYCAIPYKTPWLELNALAPAAVLAGLGLVRLGGLAPPRLRTGLTASLALLVACSLGAETERLCFRFPADPGNPLAYSPTSPDIRRLEARVEHLTAGLGPNSRIVAVVGSDIWPLPWYLRRCPQVGYWPELPGTPAPALVVSSAGQAERVARALGPGWTPELYGLRSEVLAVLFIPPAPARLGGARGP